MRFRATGPIPAMFDSFQTEFLLLLWRHCSTFEARQGTLALFWTLDAFWFVLCQDDLTVSITLSSRHWGGQSMSDAFLSRYVCSALPLCLGTSSCRKCLWYFLYGGSKSVFIIPTSATNTTGCNADPNHNRASVCFRDGCRRSVLYLAKAWYFKGGLSVKNLHGPTVQRHISWVVATVVGHACLIWHRCYMTQPFLGDRHKEHSFSQCWTRGHSRVRRYYIDWCLCIEDEYMDMSV